jgi:hypothetical protein
MKSETFEQQVLRVLNNMVKSGEVKTKSIKGVKHYALLEKEVTTKNKKRKVSAKWREAGLKSWVTRRANLARKFKAVKEAKEKPKTTDLRSTYSARAKKAWETRRAAAAWLNYCKWVKRSIAAHKAVETRRKNKALLRSKIAK